MKKNIEHRSNDDMRPEYDFASMKGGVRGKHHGQYRKGTNVVRDRARRCGSVSHRGVRSTKPCAAFWVRRVPSGALAVSLILPRKLCPVDPSAAFAGRPAKCWPSSLVPLDSSALM